MENSIVNEKTSLFKKHKKDILNFLCLGVFFSASILLLFDDFDENINIKTYFYDLVVFFISILAFSFSFFLSLKYLGENHKKNNYLSFLGFILTMLIMFSSIYYYLEI